MIVKTPEPPYYAVIFSSLRTENNDEYLETFDNLMGSASELDDFLGMESVRDGFGISVSYWKSIEGIREWKNNLQHIAAKRKGIEKWYESYMMRIARVDYDSYFSL
jgi:heme-degrading monooxygenase HmoA